MTTENAVLDLLTRLGVVDPGALEPFFPRVRDRNDLAVVRCARSGVIMLDRTDHLSKDYYVEKSAETTITVDNQEIVDPAMPDDHMRADRFGHYMLGQRWFDFGCGRAGLLNLLKGKASRAVGLELNAAHRAAASRAGLMVVERLDQLGDERFDIITLFHVLEHLTDPVGTLEALRSRLAPGGMILVEVPHARDILLATLDCDAFKGFTLWSEHLVLHTRDSLAAIMHAAGFADTDVEGYQRYPLSNHLYWLRYGRPGGHKAWPTLNQDAFVSGYEKLLQSLDQTDTIVAIATAC